MSALSSASSNLSRRLRRLAVPAAVTACVLVGTAALYVTVPALLRVHHFDQVLRDPVAAVALHLDNVVPEDTATGRIAAAIAVQTGLTAGSVLIGHSVHAEAGPGWRLTEPTLAALKHPSAEHAGALLASCHGDRPVRSLLVSESKPGNSGSQAGESVHGHWLSRIMAPWRVARSTTVFEDESEPFTVALRPRTFLNIPYVGTFPPGVPDRRKELAELFPLAFRIDCKTSHAAPEVFSLAESVSAALETTEDWSRIGPDSRLATWGLEVAQVERPEAGQLLVRWAATNSVQLQQAFETVQAKLADQGPMRFFSAGFRDGEVFRSVTHDLVDGQVKLTAKQAKSGLELRLTWTATSDATATQAANRFRGSAPEVAAIEAA